MPLYQFAYKLPHSYKLRWVRVRAENEAKARVKAVEQEGEYWRGPFIILCRFRNCMRPAVVTRNYWCHACELHDPGLHLDLGKTAPDTFKPSQRSA